jgi:hypothetical protein
MVGAAPPASPPPPWRAQSSDLRVERDGNLLVARRSATVGYETLERLLDGIESRAVAAPAIRLVRGAPGQLIDYVFCITPDGRLVVGQQVWRLDTATGGYVFERGELARAYSPLDGEARWTWLVEIAVGRESDVTLVTRADNDRWPVRNVFMTVLRSP